MQLIKQRNFRKGILEKEKYSTSTKLWFLTLNIFKAFFQQIDKIYSLKL